MVITKAIVVILNKNEYYVIELCLEHAAYLSSRAYCQADTLSFQHMLLEAAGTIPAYIVRIGATAPAVL
jgi:hypothetical protein